MKDEKPNAKVLFRDANGNVETLWATALGDDRYRIENSPWYAYGVSWQDIVEAKYNNQEEMITFVRVLEKSGNRTVRVIFEAPDVDSGRSDDVLKKVIALGCSYEGANPKYTAINLPPGVELRKLCDYLTNSNLQWEHADPTYRELYGEKA